MSAINYQQEGAIRICYLQSNETILRLRSLELRFGDRGRYEAEWRENNDSIVEQLQKATDKIKSFCSKLKKKAIKVKMYLMNFLTKNQ